MLIDKIKSFFNKNDNTHYPCCYMLTTKRNKSAIFMHNDLNTFEKRVNDLSLVNAKIISVKQGKKLFFRFLKNNSIYGLYLKFVFINKFNIDDIIKYNFITPFFIFYSKMEIYNPYYEDFINLEKDWINLLKSINYIQK